MVREICGVELMDKKNTEEIINMLRLNKMLNKLAKVNRLC